ncbi:MAG: RNase H family protein [Saprospiraceae bacterium]
MKTQWLFTDGSVNTASKIGYGAYLLVPDLTLSLDSLKPGIKLKRFEQTSSSKLELQTLLWALKEVQAYDAKFIVYTDSQNIIGLPGRRERLVRSNYYTKNHKRLRHFELYQAFYQISDQLNIAFVKISGHKAAGQKDQIDQIFALVDQASRAALRGFS